MSSSDGFCVTHQGSTHPFTPVGFVICDHINAEGGTFFDLEFDKSGNLAPMLHDDYVVAVDTMIVVEVAPRNLVQRCDPRVQTVLRSLGVFRLYTSKKSNWCVFACEKPVIWNGIQ